MDQREGRRSARVLRIGHPDDAPRLGRAEAIEEILDRLGTYKGRGVAWIAPGWRPVWDRIVRASCDRRGWRRLEAPWWGEPRLARKVGAAIGCGLLSGPDRPASIAAWRDTELAALLAGRARLLLLEDASALGALEALCAPQADAGWRRASCWRIGGFALASARWRAA